MTQGARPLSQRALRGQAQKERTRATIIRSAIPIFVERGPYAPVIDDFAKAAGVSRGTFYNYFLSTRELLDACLEVLFDQLIAQIDPVVATETNPVIRLAVGGRLFYRGISSEPVFRTLLGAVSGVGALAEEFGRKDIAQAIKEELIDVGDVNLATALMHGTTVFMLRAAEPQGTPEEQADAVMEIILRGLGVTPGLMRRALRRTLPALAPLTLDVVSSAQNT